MTCSTVYTFLMRPLLALALVVSCSACVGPKVPTYVLTAPTVVPVPPAPPVPPPTPPVVTPLSVIISAIPTNVAAGRAASFCATAQHEHGAVTYAWTFDPDPGLVTSGLPCADHAFQREGEGRVTVVASDESATASAAIRVTVLPTPPAPTTPTPTTPPGPALAATMTCTAGNATTTPTPCNVTLTYGGSPFGAGNITVVAWDWADGSVADNASTVAIKSHQYVAQGTFTVVATITATVPTTPPSSAQTTAAFKVIIP